MILQWSPFELITSISAWLYTWIVTPFQVTEPEDWFYNNHHINTLSLPAKTETWVWNLHLGAELDALK